MNFNIFHHWKEMRTAIVGDLEDQVRCYRISTGLLARACIAGYGSIAKSKIDLKISVQIKFDGVATTTEA